LVQKEFDSYSQTQKIGIHALASLKRRKQDDIGNPQQTYTLLIDSIGEETLYFGSNLQAPSTIYLDLSPHLDILVSRPE
jgi:hypothetical protein